MTVESGYLYTELGDGGYSPTHRGTAYAGQRAHRMTPNFEHKEGLRFGPFVPAPYLPAIRLEPIDYVHFVIAAGAPCAVDSRGNAVPAGLKKSLALGAGNGPKYKEKDVIAGVLNAMGRPVEEDEFVVDSMIEAQITIGAVIGVASYDVFMQLNSDPHNPATYKYHNFNKQNSFAILTNYLLEYPTVGPDGVKFSGMTTWSGDAKPGDYVTYNEKSQFIAFSPSSVAEHLECLGVVAFVHKQWPKQMLDRVQTGFDPRLNSPVIDPETGKLADEVGYSLDRAPGSATDGVPHAIQYAGGNLETAVVTFKLKL